MVGIESHIAKYRMRKVVFLLFAVAVYAISCTKNNELKSLQQDLNGTWELTKTFGGWTGEQLYSGGNGNTISFDNASYIKQVVSSDTSYSNEGVFKLKQIVLPCGDGQDLITQINFDGVDDGDFGNQLILYNNELSIGSNACLADGFVSYYRKIR